MTDEQSIIVPTEWWKALPRKVYSQLRKIESDQSWFEVYRVDPEVYVLYEPGQFEEVISYLVIGKERAALIDTGCGFGDIKALAREFTRLPVMVVNTHSHYDHIAQNYMFDEVALFDAPNARQAAKKGYSRTEMSKLLAEGMLWKPLPTNFEAENYHVPAFNVTWWLKDGDIIDLGKRSLEIVHTPGHSPDSICILDQEARLFWTGDTFYPSTIYVHLPSSDLDSFIVSYLKMIASSSRYERLMPGHNEPYLEKAMLEEVLWAAREIRAGRVECIEGMYDGRRVRRYNYPRFAITTSIS